MKGGGRAWSGGSAGRRETSKSRGPRVSSLTGIRTVDWLRIASSAAGGREGEDADANASGSARARPRGVPTPVVSMDAEKSARARGEERVVFFQSSNLLNLFFPRNVAAISKLLIAIGKVEPMGWEGSRIERGWQGRAGARGRVA